MFIEFIGYFFRGGGFLNSIFVFSSFSFNNWYYFSMFLRIFVENCLKMKTVKQKSLRPIMEIREFTCKVAAKPESDYMRSLKDN